MGTFIFLVIPTPNLFVYKLILFLFFVIAVLITYLIEICNEKKELKKQLNEIKTQYQEAENKLKAQLDDISQKHKAICYQFDEKKDLLNTYKSLLYNLKITSDTAKEKNKEKRYENVYLQIESFINQVELMEENGNDKQK